ncbi:N-6 DNA methylase [Actinopolyspora halophila]|uniref:N-6 DNA methylase n=1 Tax=Actinopolyspora halophila TaxID=1850 RepID=UPI0003A0216B|nr:N-6 DNA methylase [Actinopolyspora halophila]
MDASEFKEYIFRTLLLEHASDQFEAARERLRAIERERGRDEEELEKRLNAAPRIHRRVLRAGPGSLVLPLTMCTPRVGAALSTALVQLEVYDPLLGGSAVQHIDSTRQVGQNKFSEQKLRDLIRHFGRLRLRNEDFEFPDLLGAAYKFLIGEFADSAGRNGGEHYTPRAVVRLVEPREGIEVYDPCSSSGSGGRTAP